MSESKIGPAYIEQDGCYNCRHCYHWHDWEGEQADLCVLQGPPPPDRNGSSEMGKNFDFSTDETFNRDRLAWETWEEGREVEAWGKCASWERGEEGYLTTAPVVP